jgi:starch phosphorylase
VTRKLRTDDRTGMDAETLRRAVLDHLTFSLAKDVQSATTNDAYLAVARAVWDRLVHRWTSTQHRYAELDVKRVYYLSLEYLLGKQLEANLLTLGLRDLAALGAKEFGLDLPTLFEQEDDPGLGNGGLGRLAACFMDSLATLGYPAMGYGLRYEFGIFRQEIRDGWQVEHPDEWLRRGNPWEIRRPEYTVSVPFGGVVEEGVDPDGRFRVRWKDRHRILGVPYDTPIAGFDTNTVHTLRLWAAHASEQFDLRLFNEGDYRRAVEQKTLDEALSKVLYPNDTSIEGKRLRLEQQWFFVCCSLHDVVRRYLRSHDSFDEFPNKAAIQLNDTHPSLAVAELMRLLVDVHELEWDHAWGITVATTGYTNHTLLPEALERWPVAMFEALLPRHLQIIREIDRRFLRHVHVWSRGNEDIARRMAIVDEPHGQIRMANLAVVGSHAVNGVAELHGRLLRENLMPDFATLWPERFGHQTNGVTPRRFVLQSNPALSRVLDARVGAGWVTDLEQVRALLPLENDAGLQAEFAAVKRTNKLRLSEALVHWGQPSIDPEALLDVQIKRIHEYKRQLMCILHVMWRYHELRNGNWGAPPRVVLLGGKAAPGYYRAKQHVQLANDVMVTLEADARARGHLRLLFVPDYNVTKAERIIPAADLSEQISLAGLEASGTGNMKFMMNGALTIGTLDGANVEIRDAVGPDAFFLFGLTAEEVSLRKAAGHSPQKAIAASERLQVVLSLLDDGFFNPDHLQTHRDLAQSLRNEDPFLVTADFDAYVDAQEAVDRVWVDPAAWGQRVVRNIACSGPFSSDRTIRSYAEQIWGLTPVQVPLRRVE